MTSPPSVIHTNIHLDSPKEGTQSCSPIAPNFQLNCIYPAARDLLSLSDDAFILASPNVLQRALKMALRAVEVGVWLVLAGLQVGVDQFDQSVEVLGGDCLILLVEVVDVAIENLNEKFHGDGGVHAGVCDSKGTLEAFQDSFSVAVELL